MSVAVLERFTRPRGRMTTPRSLLLAAGLGFAGGMRTFTPTAALRLRAGAFPGPLGTALVVAAAGELVFDKVPGVPSRLRPEGLAGRATNSGLAGATVSGPAGAALGAVVALASAHGGYYARRALGRATGWPDAVWGAVEDCVALGIAGAAASAAA